MKKRNFIVTSNKKYLYITFLGKSKNTGKIYYTSYNSKLEELLNSRIFSSADTNGSTEGNYLRLYYNKSKNTVYFHHLVFCFFYRNLTIDNYIQVLADFKKELNNGFEIDHLYEDVHNNCRANLSLVPTNSNKKKIRTKGKLKFFCDLVEAYDGENYRIQFTYISSLKLKRIKTIRYYTTDFKDILDIRNYLKEPIEKIRGFNQWNIKNSQKGVLVQDSSYSVFGDYKIFRKLPKLVSELDIPDLQNNIVNLPLKDFKNGVVKLFEINTTIFNSAYCLYETAIL